MSGRRRPPARRGPRAEPPGERATHTSPTAKAPPTGLASAPAAASDSPPRAAAGPGARGPALAFPLLVAAACVLFSVSFRMDDPDVWQHLVTGKAIWRLGHAPLEHLWTWPLHGQPDVLPSWGFRALLWPFWAAAQLPGLYAWRWLTTLAAFAILWFAARRMGMRGVAATLVFVLAALTYRARSQVRPETLVAILLALEILVLESYRRAPDRRRLLPLVAIAAAWANVHLSYWIGLALVAVHAVDAWWSGRRDRARPPSPRPAAGALLAILGACAAVSFVNPYGWRALAQPFEYFLVWRHEPIFRTIAELAPLQWSTHWKSGLPLLMAGWPLLAAWRARRRGLDVAEALTLALFTWLAISTQRFAGLWAIAAAPYAARDLDEWIRARRWPAWTTRPAARAALVSAACVAIGVPEWSRREYPPGIALDHTQYPVAACDFVAQNVRGRAFNPYYFGGYQLWRFWPDRARLPFIDVHQSGTREDRRLYAYAFAEPSAWRELDRRRRFDWALVDGRPVPGDRLLETLGADTAWTLVFRDDAAAVFVRSDGPLGALARREAYRLLPASDGRVPDLMRRHRDDPAARPAIRAELDRQIASSPHHARALSILATLAWVEGRHPEARAHLVEALRIDPESPGTRQRLAMLDLAAARPHDAIRWLEQERRLAGRAPGIEFLLGQAHARAGDARRARAAYRRELEIDPMNAAARDSLAALEAR